MSDYEENEFCWEPWTLPVKRKRKKDSRHKNNNKAMKTDETIQKKKNKSKFKDEMVKKKAKKKAKQKKKNRLEHDDRFTLTEASSEQAKPTLKPKTLNERLKAGHMTQGCKKKTKVKKKVAFDLCPGYICVKRPKFVSSTPLCPTKSVLLENEGVRDSCSQVTASGQSQGPIHYNDPQCTSEDINSQDLFITQKTFKESPSEPSSGEAFTDTPKLFTQRDKQDSSVAQIKQHLDGSYKCPQYPHFHPHHQMPGERDKKPESVTVYLKEEEERLNKNHNKPKKTKCQAQMAFKANLTEEKKELCPAQVTSNPYLAEPIVMSPSADVAKSKKLSCTATQTENFFTTELSSYLNFCQKTRVAAHCEDLKPLDLSLPQRARKNLWKCLSRKTFLPKGLNRKYPNVHPSCAPSLKDMEVKKVASDQHSWSLTTQRKGETSLSPQSESEPKSADTAPSSEDNESACRTGKLDMTQVRAVQMRLNESFFFKTKGEGQSPRPQSPLMKLAQGRNVKNTKGH